MAKLKYLLTDWLDKTFRRSAKELKLTKLQLISAKDRIHELEESLIHWKIKALKIGTMNG